MCKPDAERRLNLKSLDYNNFLERGQAGVKVFATDSESNRTEL
jgi:hypothetical protein